MKRPVMLSMVAAVGCMASAFAAGETWYVDADYYGQAGLDGSSARPYGTIQQAVDAAATTPGDTILVRPGIYSNGVVSAARTGRYPCRLYVDKADLVIRSTDGRAMTHIVGKLDTTGEKGVGPESVACVLVNQAGTFVLDGFTVRDGRTTSADSDTFLGGGVFSVNMDEPSVKRNHLYDCTVENCCSRGKYVGYMTVHRSLITRNPFANAIYRSAVGSCRLENSIVAFNGSDSAGCMGVMSSPMANCIVMGSWKALSYNGNVYNSILSMNYIDSADTDAETVCTRCAFTEGREAWGTARHAKDVECVYGQKASTLFVSTRLGDWRTLAGSGAIGIGDPSRLAEVAPLPEGYVYKDYYGLPIDMNAAAINAGASQEVVTPQGGLCNFAGSGFLVDGKAFDRPLMVGNWEDFAYPTFRLRQWAVSASDPETAPLWNVTDSGNSWCARHAPDMNGRIWVMSGEVGTTKTFTAKTVSEFRYLDPANGDDANDGTAARPWKTLLSITNIADGVETVVRCAAGEYSLGEVVHQEDSISRFSIGAGQRLHFVSTNAGMTVIRGAAGDAADGVGLGAVRCVRNNSTSPVFFSGFTFCGGRTSASSDWGIGHGAVLATADSAFTTFSDCIISNCLSQESCFFGAVLLERSYLAGCGTKAGGPFSAYGAHLASCVVQDMVVPSYCRMLSSVRAVNCTFQNDVNAKADWGAFTWDDSDLSKCSRVCNCVFADFGVCSRATDTPNVTSSLFWKSDTGALFDDCRTGDPLFLDAVAGDFRVARGSAAQDVGTCEPDYFRDLATSDREGCPLVRDGRTASGAYVMAAAGPYVSFDGPNGLLSVDGSQEAAVRLLDPGESVTVAIADGAKRPVVGVALNGVTNLFASSESLQITYDQALAADGLFVEPVVGSGWYANANTDPSKGVVGDDAANSGSQPAFPKRTLAAALAFAVEGDVVWAAPGRYDDKTMDAGSKVTVARADLPAGVTLRSTGGAARTFIVGAPASEPDEYGCGSDAVRCVYLAPGSCVEGFTLTGGRGQTLAQSDENYAGAAVAAKTGTPVVRDCVITNCAGRRAIVYQVALERCCVLGNTVVDSQLVRRGRLDNVLFAENRINRTAMQYVDGMVNVTWHYSNKTLDGSEIVGELDYHDESTPTVSAVNCLFFDCTISKAYATTNCVLTNPYVVQRTCDCNWRKITDISKLRLDADYRPVIEPGNALVDTGTNLLVAATDASGMPRISNGAIDIGAMEADWTSLYGNVLGPRVSVTDASPEVRLTDERTLSLGAGGSLVLDLTVGDEPVDCAVSVRVTGTGVLTASRNGETVATFTASPADQTLAFGGTGIEHLAFAYEAGTEDDGSAEIVRARVLKGFGLIVR